MAGNKISVSTKEMVKECDQEGAEVEGCAVGGEGYVGG